MQQLILHPAWDKTISERDREKFNHTFSNIQFPEEKSVQMTVMTHALNYKGDLLVTGIIHNLTETVYSPKNEEVFYQQEEKILARHTFSIPDLVIKAKTSTPWTFIFPQETIVARPSAQIGKIVIHSNTL